MTNFNHYFTAGPKGTISLKPGVNFAHKGTYLQVFNNTEIDRWSVGDFCSASYYITAEFDLYQKETMQILVVARPDKASVTVYGRVSIEDQLLNITAQVTASSLILTATPTSPAFAGTRVNVLATYSESMIPVSIPT